MKTTGKENDTYITVFVSFINTYRLIIIYIQHTVTVENKKPYNKGVVCDAKYKDSSHFKKTDCWFLIILYIHGDHAAETDRDVDRCLI